MLKLINYEGKTEEQALEKCMSEMNLKREDFIYKVEYTPGKLFNAFDIVEGAKSNSFAKL